MFVNLVGINILIIFAIIIHWNFREGGLLLEFYGIILAHSVIPFIDPRSSLNSVVWLHNIYIVITISFLTSSTLGYPFHLSTNP